jgi:hypothetical protein
MRVIVDLEECVIERGIEQISSRMRWRWGYEDKDLARIRHINQSRLSPMGRSALRYDGTSIDLHCFRLAHGAEKASS